VTGVRTKLARSDERSDAPTRRGAREQAFRFARPALAQHFSCRSAELRDQLLSTLGIGDTFGFTVKIGQLDVSLTAQGKQLEKLGDDITSFVRLAAAWNF
jgi:hypothetical protein